VDTIGIGLGFILLTIIIIGCVVGYRMDRRIWNGGICRKNGLPWQVRDYDSQGGALLRAGNVTAWLHGWIRP